MNKKISKILGVGLAVAMLASLLVMATPASASALGWGEDTATKYLKGNADTANRVLANTDILDMSNNGNTVYAATADNASGNINAVYKSTDGGVTWTSHSYHRQHCLLFQRWWFKLAKRWYPGHDRCH
jgi:hypothetical protein